MKTFENQHKLPRLPIPKVEDTLQTYLKSIEPFLTSEELKQHSLIVKDFEEGLGPVLQERLIAYDKTQKNSWLEKWWLEYAYLSWRNSVMVHSNWFLITNTPKNTTPPKVYQEGYTKYQINRAAGYASNLLDYKDLIDNELIPPSLADKFPLDMNQYKKIFGITRVPKPGCDIVVESFPCKSRHIILLIKDQMFSVNVYDKSGARLKIKDIEKQFNTCVEMAEKGKVEEPVCILSTQHRDDWARDHNHLLSLGRNKYNLSIIETALFSVALDHKLLPAGNTKNTFHAMNGHNRWFDKSITICVSNDGRIGVNGEHSPCDALIPALLIDYACKNEPAKDPPNSVSDPQIDPIRKLEWIVDDVIKTSLAQAQIFIDKTIGDSDVEVFHYKGYGGDFIKKHAKVSPDAFNQMCIQLAFFRVHGYCTGVYETAATRKYLHGRTETTRSYSMEQKQFVEIFQSKKPLLEKYLAFQKACNKHVEYIKIASDGMGCDRHLFGLQRVMRKGETHELFTHPVFAKSSKWQLSTSALFPSENLPGTGFGTVYPDGYGMNYVIMNDFIKFGIESKYSCNETSTRKFIIALEGVYEDMKTMCEAASGPPSKL